MIVHTEFKQGDVEWMLARAGIPTASEFDQLLTPEFKIRTGEMPKTYLAKKVAERWQGGPLPSCHGFDMEQGQLLEGEAIPWAELEYGWEIKRVGFITTNDKRVGCSPDGLVTKENLTDRFGMIDSEDFGLEIKCPHAETQVRYLLGGSVPKDYLCQVHGAMYVTGFPRWKFLSYRRHFPPLLVTVERDEKIQAQIAEALAQFAEQFDGAMAEMTALNGGPPPQLTPMTPMRAITEEAITICGGTLMKKILPQLQHEVDVWNATCPNGSAVNVEKDDGSILQSNTRSAAWLMGGHTPVVMVDGISGSYLLSRVTPVRTLSKR